MSNMMKAPPPLELLALLEKVPALRVRHVTSWSAMRQSRHSRPQEEAHYRVADKLAHGLAGHLFERKGWRERQEPEGYVVDAAVYCFDFDSLVALLQQAHDVGRRLPIGVMAMAMPMAEEPRE